MTELIEMRLIFSGQVQGVGFRASASNLAKQLHLTGTIKNLSDGSVEAIIQGDHEKLYQFAVLLENKFNCHAVTEIQQIRAPFTAFKVI